MADDPFLAFVQDRRADLRRIAAATRREQSLDDVVNEAWLLARTLAGAAPPDYADPAFQKTLLAHLFQKLVRYTETTVRYAARLDQALPGHEADDASATLAARLAGREDDDPLVARVRAEEQQANTLAPLEWASPAGVWLLLLQRFDHRMDELSRFLRISVSHAYRCRGKARLTTLRQHSVALEAQAGELRPWRLRHAERAPRQLVLEFGGEAPLFSQAGVYARRCAEQTAAASSQASGVDGSNAPMLASAARV